MPRGDNRKSKGSAALGQRGESHAPGCLRRGHSADPLLARRIQSLFRTVRRRVQTRTAWSLHNAFTAVAKEIPITTRMPAIQELGRYFGMTNGTSERRVTGPRVRTLGLSMPHW